jgi:hypothetical protein
LKLRKGIGHSGTVIGVSFQRLEVKTDRGKIEFLERPHYELFGQSEANDVLTVVYPQDDGNLVPLLQWVSQELGLAYESHAVQPGQIAGFFPPYPDLKAFLDDLVSIGVKRSPGQVTLELQPRLKLVTSSFQRSLYFSDSLDQLLARFDDLLPQDVHWTPFGERIYWYSGQQLISVLNQFNLHPSYQDNKLFLLREKTQ